MTLTDFFGVECECFLFKRLQNVFLLLLGNFDFLFFIFGCLSCVVFDFVDLTHVLGKVLADVNACSVGRVKLVDVSARAAFGLELLLLDHESCLRVLAFLAEKVLLNKSVRGEYLIGVLLVEGFEEVVIGVLPFQD
jgi:hypothetical protein